MASERESNPSSQSTTYIILGSSRYKGLISLLFINTELDPKLVSLAVMSPRQCQEPTSGKIHIPLVEAFWI